MKPVYCLARRWQAVFGRMILTWGITLAAALLAAGAECMAAGQVYHRGLIANTAAVLLLAGLIDGVISLFSSGWYRFDETGYHYHNPWRGFRLQRGWDQVTFLALVPGSMVMSRSKLCIMLAAGEGDPVELEYRWERLENLRRLRPGLAIAAYTEDLAVVKICRKLAQLKIGWLPLSWVQHGDGTGELVLRKRSIPPQARAAYTTDNSISQGERIGKT